MKKNSLTRRQAISLATFPLAAAALGIHMPRLSILNRRQDKLALLGGPRVHNSHWPDWPVWNSNSEKGITAMLRSGRWWRGNGEHVAEFEKLYAELVGARRCLATASGTSALTVALESAGVDAGDEVIVSPYTFVASYNVIIMQKALPVFADSDPDTFLIDTSKIESKITDRTSAIIPVHIYGLPVDMDKVNVVASKHKLKVIEDACQAWMAVYKGRKAGTFGDAGCFSFQNSKNLPAGEGGAIVSNNDELMDRCHTVHNCGRPYGSVKRTSNYPLNGGNSRMQQIQALILMSQIERIVGDSEIRHRNATYLTGRLKEIPGIVPFRLSEGAERSAYHFYPFRFLSGKFDGLTREKFIKALNAEGIPCGEGYGSPYREGLFDQMINSKGYNRLFPESRLKQWKEESYLPGNDTLCNESVILYQSILLGTQNDMDDIFNSIYKVYRNRSQLM